MRPIIDLPSSWCEIPPTEDGFPLTYPSFRAGDGADHGGGVLPIEDEEEIFDAEEAVGPAAGAARRRLIPKRLRRPLMARQAAAARAAPRRPIPQRTIRRARQAQKLAEQKVKGLEGDLDNMISQRDLAQYQAQEELNDMIAQRDLARHHAQEELEEELNDMIAQRDLARHHAQEELEEELNDMIAQRDLARHHAQEELEEELNDMIAQRDLARHHAQEELEEELNDMIAQRDLARHHAQEELEEELNDMIAQRDLAYYQAQAELDDMRAQRESEHAYIRKVLRERMQTPEQPPVEKTRDTGRRDIRGLALIAKALSKGG